MCHFNTVRKQYCSGRVVLQDCTTGDLQERVFPQKSGICGKSCGKTKSRGEFKCVSGGIMRVSYAFRRKPVDKFSAIACVLCSLACKKIRHCLNFHLNRRRRNHDEEGKARYVGYFSAKREGIPVFDRLLKAGGKLTCPCEDAKIKTKIDPMGRCHAWSGMKNCCAT